MSVKIFLDEYQLEKVTSLEIVKNWGYDADEFSFQVPLTENVFDRIARAKGEEVKIFLEDRKVFSGIIDTAEFVYSDSGEIIDVTGRDWTAILQDTTADKDLVNDAKGKTASEIVKMIADKAKIKYSIQKTSKTYDERSFSAGSALWDIVVALARMEGFNAYVTSDKVLVFRKPLRKGIKEVFSWKTGEGRQPLRLTIDQDKTLSLSLKVIVIGWDPQQKKEIESDPAESPLKQRPGYKTIVVQNMSIKSKEEANYYARKLLEFYSRNYVRGELEIPLAPDFEVEDLIELKGVGDFSGVYYVEEIRHRYDITGNITTLTFSKQIIRGEQASLDELESNT